MELLSLKTIRITEVFGLPKLILQIQSDVVSLPSVVKHIVSFQSVSSRQV